MPYQNRVTPYGDPVAVNSRGTLMGNRGCIHDAQGNLKSKKWKARISELPDGTMVTLADFEGAYLIKNGRLLKWTFDRYSPAEKYTNDKVVGVLTPPSIVRVILT